MLNIYKCCYKNVKKQRLTLIGYEDGVIDDSDIEDLHQMRVSVRRLRALLQFFSVFIDADIHNLIKTDLKLLARNLGNVRDIDVSLEYFYVYLEKNPDHEGVKYLIKEYKKRRKPLRKRLISFLETRNYKNLKRNLMLLSKNLNKKAQEVYDDAVYTQYYNSLEKIIDDVFYFQTIDDLNSSEENLHNLRIAIKYLRYNMEFINLKNEYTQKTLKYLKMMQEKLGIINDYAFINGKLAEEIKSTDLSQNVIQKIKEIIAYYNDLKDSEVDFINFPWDELSLKTLKESYLIELIK